MAGDTTEHLLVPAPDEGRTSSPSPASGSSETDDATR